MCVCDACSVAASLQCYSYKYVTGVDSEISKKKERFKIWNLTFCLGFTCTEIESSIVHSNMQCQRLQMSFELLPLNKI